MSVRFERADMDVIGHRGCAAEFPENTLAAIRGCAPRVDMIELDLRRCRSGELVVFHDETLDRLTDETGPVSEFDYAELSELTVGGSDEPIPTLTDALDGFPEDTGLNIELKEVGLGEQTLDLVSNCSRELLVSSFDPAALEPFRDTRFPTAFLCAESVEEALETALELDCEYVHPHHTAVDAKCIDRAHEHGLGVNAWTVPTESEVRRLREGGIDGVVVDSWTVVPGT